MNAHTTLPDPALAALVAEVATLRAGQAVLVDEVAALRALVVKPRPPPSAEDRRLLAEIVARVLHGVPFQCGDYVDKETAKLWGECLARLLPHGVVDEIEIERVREIGHRAAWLVRYVGGPEVP